MHVVFGDVTAYDLYGVGITDFPYEISDSITQFTREYWLTVLGTPYDMVFDVVDGMTSSAIELHVVMLAYLERIA